MPEWLRPARVSARRVSGRQRRTTGGRAAAAWQPLVREASYPPIAAWRASGTSRDTVAVWQHHSNADEWPHYGVSVTYIAFARGRWRVGNRSGDSAVVTPTEERL